METINNECNGDVHCRYKMPSLDTLQDGRSKQRRTWLLNLCDVAESIHRNPELLLQYYQFKGFVAGCHRSSGVARYYVKGHHDREALRQVVRDFCSQLVVCPSCKGIDTYLYTINSGTKKKPLLVIKMVCDTSAHTDTDAHIQDTKLARHIPEKATAVVESLGGIQPPPHSPVTKLWTESSAKDQSTIDSLAKYQRKLAKAESRGEAEEKVERLRKKVDKYAAKLAACSTGSAAHQQLEKDDEEEEWFTDVSMEAVTARAAQRGLVL